MDFIYSYKNMTKIIMIFGCIILMFLSVESLYSQDHSTYWGQNVQILYPGDSDVYNNPSHETFTLGTIHSIISEPASVSLYPNKFPQSEEQLEPVYANKSDGIDDNDTVLFFTSHGSYDVISPLTNEYGINPDNVEILLYFDVPLNYKSLAGYDISGRNTLPLLTNEYDSTNIEIRLTKVRIGNSVQPGQYSGIHNHSSITTDYTILTDCYHNSNDTNQPDSIYSRPNYDTILITLSNLESNKEYELRINHTILDSLNTYMDRDVELKFKTYSRAGEAVEIESDFEGYGVTRMVVKQGMMDTAGYFHISYMKTDIENLEYDFIKRYDDVPEPKELNVLDISKLGGKNPENPDVIAKPGGARSPIGIIKGSIRDFRFNIHDGNNWIDYFDRDNDGVADGSEDHGEATYKFNVAIDYKEKGTPADPPGVPCVLEIPYKVSDDYKDDGSPGDVVDAAGKATGFKEDELKMFRLTKIKGEYQWEIIKGSYAVKTAEDKYPERGKKRIRAVVDHLSVYALFGVKPPAETVLWWAYPNPFYPLESSENRNKIYIPFELAKTGNVTITILTITAEKVKVIVDNEQFQPEHVTFQTNIPSWDGKNWNGNYVASGVYLVKFDVEYEDGTKHTSVKKIAVVK